MTVVVDSGSDEAVEQSRPPAGFVLLGGYCGAFIAHCGPLFGRLRGDELTLGFRVLERHTNPLGQAHGGMLSSLADMTLAGGAMYKPAGWGRILPTISLQLDFLAPAKLGAWVQGSTEVLKATGSLVFAQCLIDADGATALRASAVFKLGPAPADAAQWDPFGLRR
jgi:uncharacterized protein (TIGR00369 family)